MQTLQITNIGKTEMMCFQFRLCSWIKQKNNRKEKYVLIAADIN